MEKKMKVMEALLSCNNGLSKDEILWAESHLPNEKGNGSNVGPNSVIRYNHDAKTITEAMSITDEDFENASELLASGVKSCPKISMAVEKVINESQNCPRFWEVLVLKAVNDCHNHFQKVMMKKMEGMDDLSDNLDKMKKLLEEIKKLKRDTDKDGE